MNPLIKVAKEALEEAVGTGAAKGAKVGAPAPSSPAPRVISGPDFDSTQVLPANFNPDVTQRLPSQKPQTTSAAPPQKASREQIEGRKRTAKAGSRIPPPIVKQAAGKNPAKSDNMVEPPSIVLKPQPPATPPPSAPPATPPPSAPPATPPPLTHQAAELEPSDSSFWRIFAGDTSGKAAANAGAEFMAGAERVFAGEASAKASGVESNILKQAWKATDDDAFEDVLKRGGASDDAVTNLSAFRSEIQKVDNEGGQLSEEGMSAMMKNQEELGSMYGGFNRAGASASPNALLRAIGGESGHGFGNAMGIAAVAGLAGGANVAMGGDFTEGAAVGGGVAFGARAIAKGVAGSMGDIENAMVKSILGDDAVTAGARKTLGKEVSGQYSPGTELSSIEKGSGLTLNDLGIGKGTAQGDTLLDDFASSVETHTGSQTRLKAKASGGYSSTPETIEQVTGAQARRENLTSIAAMKGDDERLKGFGKKKMQKLLDPNKENNVAMNNRLLTLGGGMLAGVAFTGQSDKRNYRRGFNAHRGNRI